jgi:hypothetical protein
MRSAAGVTRPHRTASATLVTSRRQFDAAGQLEAINPPALGRTRTYIGHIAGNGIRRPMDTLGKSRTTQSMTRSNHPTGAAAPALLSTVADRRRGLVLHGADHAVDGARIGVPERAQALARFVPAVRPTAGIVVARRACCGPGSPLPELRDRLRMPVLALKIIAKHCGSPGAVNNRAVQCCTRCFFSPRHCGMRFAVSPARPASACGHDVRKVLCALA